MHVQVDLEPENIIVLHYYSLTCLLLKKYTNCLEALKLIRIIYELNYSSKRATFIEYYKAKSQNIEKLVKNLLPKWSALD